MSLDDLMLCVGCIALAAMVSISIVGILEIIIKFVKNYGSEER